MPYQAPYAQYTPMASWSAPAAPVLPTSDQVLKQNMAQIQPMLSAQQSQYQQAMALQNQMLALERQRQQQAAANFYYSTPPWSARQASAPVPVAAPQAAMPQPTMPEDKRTPAEMTAAFTAGAKKYSGHVMTPEQLANLEREAGMVYNDRGRYVMPNLAY